MLLFLPTRASPFFGRHVHHYVYPFGNRLKSLRLQSAGRWLPLAPESLRYKEPGSSLASSSLTSQSLRRPYVLAALQDLYRPPLLVPVTILRVSPDSLVAIDTLRLPSRGFQLAPLPMLLLTHTAPSR